MFDVRFLNNPHFVPELKDRIGTDPEVRDFVFADPRTDALVTRLADLLNSTIPEYEREGRNYLTVGIGCTGGRHRSVAVAHAIARAIAPGHGTVEVRLRDVNDRRDHHDRRDPKAPAHRAREGSG